MLLAKINTPSPRGAFPLSSPESSIAQRLASLIPPRHPIQPAVTLFAT